jgi:site-specific recombinase XerD
MSWTISIPVILEVKEMKKFSSLLTDYEKYYLGLGFKKTTFQANKRHLERFYAFLEDKNKTDLRTVRKEDILSFVEVLKNTVSQSTGRPLHISTIATAYHTVKNFYSFLYLYEHIIVNPFEDMNLQFKKAKNSRGIFTEHEIAEFLDSISLDEKSGQRDRACFELMYSSALRIGDIVLLDLSDVDMQERILLIRGGKGDKDAYLPFSEVAQSFLQKYIADERQRQLKRVPPDEQKALFLHNWGRISKGVIDRRFRLILEASGIEKKDRSCHSIRHSTATHLLEAGADIRFVSELLRHDNLETTAKYTHLPMDNLKRAYRKAHPRENDYYEEISEEYLQEVDKLVEDLKELGKRYCK